ncbi:MAG: hypothetical protein LUF29_08185 [Oscillospiraceae bacterium]|nr:hypothetical protein [Oscillospiraceae bacterium]
MTGTGQEHMCKLMEDFRDEVAKDSAIEASIDTARRYGATDETILEDIMEQFEISEGEAKGYLLKKSA